jgi:hypothetical protein
LELRLYLEEKKTLVSKRLGCDFKIICRKRKQNMVANSLSRKDEDVEALLCAFFIIQLNWVVEVREEWKNDLSVWKLIQKI